MNQASQPAQAYQAYQATGVETASQGRLIVMLYDGAIRFMRQGAHCIGQRDIEGAHQNLVRSGDILSELLGSLRPERGGEVGLRLKQLYVYLLEQLVAANLSKDLARVEHALKIMCTLREGWAEALKAGNPAGGTGDPPQAAKFRPRLRQVG